MEPLFKIGDRVKYIGNPHRYSILNYVNKNYTIKIVDNSAACLSNGTTFNKYLIEYYDNACGYKQQGVNDNEVILDIEYYRDLKIKNILGV